MNEVDELDGEIRRLLAEVGDAVGPPPTFDRLGRGGDGGERRRWIVPVAAATVLVLGVVGLVALRRDGTDRPRPVATMPTTATTAPPVTSVDAESSGEPWFLPTTMPAGYELTDISARTDELPVVGMSESSWVRRGPDGRVIVDRIEVFSGRAAAGETPPIDSALTVHGVSASLSTSGADGRFVNLRWTEGDVEVILQAQGVTVDELVVVAEASRLESTILVVDPASVPAGFEPIPSLGETSPPGGELVFLAAAPSDGSSGAIWADLSTVGPSASLDSVVGAETQRRTVDGTEVSIFTRAADELGPFTSVTFVRDGRLHVVTGRAPIETVIEFARALQPASGIDAAAAADEITRRAQLLPELARGTFADGVEVTARGAADGGAIALCVELPVAVCHRPTTEATLAGGGEVRLVDVFTLSPERRILVGWRADLGDVTAADGTPVQLVEATSGRLFVIEVDAGRALPQLQLDGAQPVQIAVTEVRRP